MYESNFERVVLGYVKENGFVLRCRFISEEDVKFSIYFIEKVNFSVLSIEILILEVINVDEV